MGGGGAGSSSNVGMAIGAMEKAGSSIAFDSDFLLAIATAEDRFRNILGVDGGQGDCATRELLVKVVLEFNAW